jgi:hypothetical protein
MERLSDASFLGKLLVLQANVRLVWKEIAGYKHSSLFGLVISDKEKKFYNIDTWRRYIDGMDLVLSSMVAGRSRWNEEQS